MLLVTGKGDDEAQHLRSLSLQLHLLGYSIPEIILLLTKDKKLRIFCSNNIANKLAPLGTASPSGEFALEMVIKSGNPDTDAQTAIGFIRSSGSGRRVGVIMKEHNKTQEGKFAEPVKMALRNAAGLQIVDFTEGLAQVLQVKDSKEVDTMRQSGEYLSTVMKNYVIKQVVARGRSGKSMKNSDLARRIEAAIKEPAQHGSRLEAEDVDSTDLPLVLSGKDLNLDYRAETSDNPLVYDTVVVSMGAMFRNYSTSVARTIMFEPTEEHKKAYALLQECVQAAKAVMLPGRKLKEVHEAVDGLVMTKRPDLREALVKNSGAGIGLEFRDNKLALNLTNMNTFKVGMVFNLAIGFSGVRPSPPAPGEKPRPPFAVMLGDTYVITESGPQCLTPNAPRNFEELSFSFEEEEEDAEGDGEGAEYKMTHRLRPRDAITSAWQESDEHKRRQLEIAKRRAEEGLRRHAQQELANAKVAAKPVTTSISYSDVSKYPAAARTSKVYVDNSAETLLCPINGHLVPFHINTIKRVHKAEEGPYVILRIQFNVPDGRAGSPEATSKSGGPGSVYIRELTYRSKSQSLGQVVYAIRALQADIKARQEAAETQKTMAEQESLRILQNAPNRLVDLSVRPPVSRARKSTGRLTAHVNGFRYQAHDNNYVDFTYKNIKCCFFKKADKRSREVLIHFEFKDPIVIPSTNKKTTWLQFYVEVIDAVHDVGMASRYDDEEEIRAEEEEQIRRRKWNEKFGEFVKGVEKQWEQNNPNLTIRFEKPVRELAFMGMPNKELTEMIPTPNALVALDDKPPLVFMLNEIEAVVLERVMEGLREFDMTVVFKDLKRMPHTITTVSMAHINAIRKWLTSCGILCPESRQNIAWRSVMPEILKDVAGFYADGGFMTLVEDDEEEDEDEDEAESESEYSEESEEESEEDDFDSSDYASEEDESDYASEEEDEDEDNDWEALERKALEEERKAKLRRKRGDDDY